jgi:hypothetical protein
VAPARFLRSRLAQRTGNPGLALALPRPHESLRERTAEENPSAPQGRRAGEICLARKGWVSTEDDPACPDCIYLGGVQAELYAPLAQVVPLGPVATPFPFLVLDLPPPVVWVVVTPFEFLFAVAPLPVFGL